MYTLYQDADILQDVGLGVQYSASDYTVTKMYTSMSNLSNFRLEWHALKCGTNLL